MPESYLLPRVGGEPPETHGCPSFRGSHGSWVAVLQLLPHAWITLVEICLILSGI